MDTIVVSSFVFYSAINRIRTMGAYIARLIGDNGMLTVIRDLCRIMHSEVCQELGSFYYSDQPMGRAPELCRWQLLNSVV
ncbi:hypothetical protein ACP70R_048861 [Stipagrostis hirtigluma subsp. patula]